MPPRSAPAPNLGGWGICFIPLQKFDFRLCLPSRALNPSGGLPRLALLCHPRQRPSRIASSADFKSQPGTFYAPISVVFAGTRVLRSVAFGDGLFRPIGHSESEEKNSAGTRRQRPYRHLPRASFSVMAAHSLSGAMSVGVKVPVKVRYVLFTSVMEGSSSQGRWAATTIVASFDFTMPRCSPPENSRETCTT